PAIRLIPWLALYLAGMAVFLLLYSYWKSWTRPIQRLAFHCRHPWQKHGSLTAIRLAAAILAAGLIPSVLPLLEARIDNALIFKSYPVGYFSLLCLYVAVSIVFLRCAVNPALVWRWLKKATPDAAAGPITMRVPSNDDENTGLVDLEKAQRLDGRVCA